jgi:ribonuclease P protein component
MPTANVQTLCRKERIKSKILIDKLFNDGNSRAMTVFPLRFVYVTNESNETNNILISVPKRYLKHAVDRNKVKRQIREAYRKNKDIIADRNDISMAFIWIDNKIQNTGVVESKVKKLLHQLSERI